MRVIYLDESGSSKPEPVLVVAGVIVHGDQQWKKSEACILELVERCVPSESRAGFIFHAKELFHTSDDSRRALNELAAIPRTIGLPVVFGYVRKGVEMANLVGKQAASAAGVYQSIALCLCASIAENYLRNETDKNDIAELSVEENTTIGNALRGMGNFMRGLGNNPETLNWWRENLCKSPDDLPLRKIVDSPNFKTKQGAFLLQLADVCAYTIRLYIQNPSNPPALPATIDARKLLINNLTGGQPDKIGSSHQREDHGCGSGVIKF